MLFVSIVRAYWKPFVFHWVLPVYICPQQLLPGYGYRFLGEEQLLTGRSAHVLRPQGCMLDHPKNHVDISF
jgi:hypothetical protein